MTLFILDPLIAEYWGGGGLLNGMIWWDVRRYLLNLATSFVSRAGPGPDDLSIDRCVRMVVMIVYSSGSCMSNLEIAIATPWSCAFVSLS
jgi:hypothetical protein